MQFQLFIFASVVLASADPKNTAKTIVQKVTTYIFF